MQHFLLKMFPADQRCSYDLKIHPAAMDLPPRPTLFDFHGVSMTRFFTDNWENVQKLKARPDDIVLASYPKAGGDL